MLFRSFINELPLCALSCLFKLRKTKGAAEGTRLLSISNSLKKGLPVSIRHNWTFDEIKKIYDLPLLELVFQAAQTHRKYFTPNKVQISNLVSIKTGGCQEDCQYCPQAARYQTGVKRQKLMDLDDVLLRAEKAKERGSSRMCLGAAWREVKDNKQFDQVLQMVKKITEKIGRAHV